MNGHLSKEFFSISSNEMGSEVKVRLRTNISLESSDICTPTPTVKFVN